MRTAGGKQREACTPLGVHTGWPADESWGRPLTGTARQEARSRTNSAGGFLPVLSSPQSSCSGKRTCEDTSVCQARQQRRTYSGQLGVLVLYAGADWWVVNSHCKCCFTPDLPEMCQRRARFWAPHPPRQRPCLCRHSQLHRPAWRCVAWYCPKMVSVLLPGPAASCSLQMLHRVFIICDHKCAGSRE